MKFKNKLLIGGSIVLGSVTIGLFLNNKKEIARFENITKGKIAKIIENEAKIYKQDPKLLKTCALTESLNSNTPNVFQLETKTYIEIAIELYHAGHTDIDTTSAGLNNLESSIKCGVKHFSRLLYKYSDHYGGNYKSYYPQIQKIISDQGLNNLSPVVVMSLIAHNRGEGNMDKWLKNGCNFKDLPRITKEHIARADRNMRWMRKSA